MNFHAVNVGFTHNPESSIGRSEQAKAHKLGVEEFKFATNDEMFTVMGC